MSSSEVIDLVSVVYRVVNMAIMVVGIILATVTIKRQRRRSVLAMIGLFLFFVDYLVSWMLIPGLQPAGLDSATAFVLADGLSLVISTVGWVLVFIAVRQGSGWPTYGGTVAAAARSISCSAGSWLAAARALRARSHGKEAAVARLDCGESGRGVGAAVALTRAVARVWQSPDLAISTRTAPRSRGSLEYRGLTVELNHLWWSSASTSNAAVNRVSGAFDRLGRHGSCAAAGPARVPFSRRSDHAETGVACSIGPAHPMRPRVGVFEHGRAT